jgi:hypothetical protein
VDYTTYWSVLDTPSRTISSNSIFIYVAIGAGLLWLLTKKFKRDKGDGEKIILLWATGVFAILGIAGCVLMSFFYEDKSNELILESLNSPTTPKVEGVISDFKRTVRHTRAGGETIESFTVDSIQFSYSDAAMGKFNSFSQTNNNVIFNGQKVRITYADRSKYDGDVKTILRLEIAR